MGLDAVSTRIGLERLTALESSEKSTFSPKNYDFLLCYY